ncbi:ABC-type Fe3+/spermidine/putrescine transport system ATPase subunit [Halanaerobium saccharolyticum]|uniref:ABC-type quaternary amine transporter n=1 Tax=Halanaerobium saccharolyticum TaxID=43595 RepID=A0A4R7Z6Y2_9FIRM|nr:ABC transporter ATP-binding protein [Halanaerobium saccharolyticum]RAK08628.1 ABC-type Fe3+/spermidine/putrescine transport system ATPase subunit [Halanaerobium saccharolyticum]TDW07229.1 ABC-type Fe3+/spermidine/putrescine transport system ATPase subunit [Halanaerobium saccharolyticum]TDX60180.1 ABC-type Fe3+/spermidine/putrescine transport system ATPase subunit [Halanaerobium saccharolyticum]
MSRITIENLSKKFDQKEVLKNLNLEVRAEEMVALLGPSGCGKTTTLKLISGLLAADTGDIKFDGNSVIELPTEKRGAVLVFQENLLFPHLNIEENIAFGLKMSGVEKKIRTSRVTELLELVNLPGYQKRMPGELSGGQQQRIALARALAVNPRVLLLDEPISNLDANLREEMRELIRKIHEEENMTTIFVTHDREEALLVADRIAVMKNGSLEQIGTPEELYRSPVNRYVANFFGQANYIRGCKLGDEFYPDCQNTELKHDQEAEKKLVMIRPEFLHLTKEEFSDSDLMVLKSKIIKRSYAGERIYYQVEADKLQDPLRVIDYNLSNFEAGEEVFLHIPLAKAAYLKE